MSKVTPIPEISLDDAARAALMLYVHAMQTKQKDFSGMLHRWLNKNTPKVQDPQLKARLEIAMPPWKA